MKPMKGDKSYVQIRELAISIIITGLDNILNKRMDKNWSTYDNYHADVLWLTQEHDLWFEVLGINKKWFAEQLEKCDPEELKCQIAELKAMKDL